MKEKQALNKGEVNFVSSQSTSLGLIETNEPMILAHKESHEAGILMREFTIKEVNTEMEIIAGIRKTFEEKFTKY